MFHQDVTPVKIASGLTFGFIIGVTPLDTLHGTLAIGCIFIFRFQVFITLTSAILFSILSSVADPILHAVGVWVLKDIESLTPLFNTLSDIPIIPFTRFNNSIVMGALFFSVIGAPILFVISFTLLKRSWAKWYALFLDSRLWAWWQAFPPYIWYKNYESMETPHAPS
jgi:uncharacterized protein (TIGR03546 family)